LPRFFEILIEQLEPINDQTESGFEFRVRRANVARETANGFEKYEKKTFTVEEKVSLER
jgi:hypothetical protein